jgi:hypothetical protein
MEPHINDTDNRDYGPVNPRMQQQVNIYGWVCFERRVLFLADAASKNAYRAGISSCAE